jgi:hypothetical protein
MVTDVSLSNITYTGRRHKLDVYILMMANRVILSPDALFQDIDGEGVILDLKSSSYFGVDQVGVRLWQCLQQNPALAPALDQLEAEFEVSRAQLENDIAAFLASLVEAELATLE